MNWYKKIAMPLPKTIYPDYDKNSTPNWEYTEDTLNSLLKNEFPFDNETLSLKDNGAFGMIYEHNSDPDKIIKITYDTQDYKSAMHVHNRQKNGEMDYIVTIYNVNKINDDVFIIEAEKINPLSELESAIITSISYKFVYYDTVMTEEIKTNIINDVLKYYNLFYKEDYKINVDKKYIGLLLDKYLNLVKKVITDNFKIIDLHGYNIGTRSGSDEYVILDLGAIKI